MHTLHLFILLQSMSPKSNPVRSIPTASLRELFLYGRLLYQINGSQLPTRTPESVPREKGLIMRRRRRLEAVLHRSRDPGECACTARSVDAETCARRRTPRRRLAAVVTGRGRRSARCTLHLHLGWQRERTAACLAAGES